MQEKSKGIYFPGLNGIRSIAATLVIFMHFNQFAYLFRLSRFYPETSLANIAVTMFFVLSGFLITYLLLEEKLQYGTISLSKFYIRRILRIWPLYYTVIFLSFLAYWNIPLIHTSTDLRKTAGLFIFFLPNYAYSLGLTMIPITPLWSIGVEEQFYAIWPVLFRKATKTKQLEYSLLLFFLVFFTLKVCLGMYENGFWYMLLTNTRLDCMALGGLGAYLYKFQAQPWLKIIYHPVAQILVVGILLITIFYKPVHLFSLIDNEFYALLSLILILNVSTNPATMVKLEVKVLNYLGRISYGLYAYHMLVICLLASLCSDISFPDTLTVQVGLCAFVIMVSIGLSSLSFFYFERRFIHLKEKFVRVVSSNATRGK